MNASRLLWKHLGQNRLIALLAPRSPQACIDAYEALHPLGVVLEIALRSDAALDGIAAVLGRHPDALLLAGTVMTAGEARQAIDAGAAGVVSPDYFAPVVEVCAQRNVMCIPGGLGDVGKQLVQKAALYGCTPAALREHRPYQWVHKLFPAMPAGSDLLGLAQSWKAVYPGLTIVYTGGVTADNLDRIVSRDPAGIACGSALTRQIDDLDATKTEAQRWLAILRGAQRAD